jgi:hypothetical protein
MTRPEHYDRRVGDHAINPATLAVALLLGIQTVSVFTLLGMFQGLSYENTGIVKEHAHLKEGMHQVADRCSRLALELNNARPPLER